MKSDEVRRDRCASVPPICPAPMSAIFLRAIEGISLEYAPALRSSGASLTQNAGTIKRNTGHPPCVAHHGGATGQVSTSPVMLPDTVWLAPRGVAKYSCEAISCRRDAVRANSKLSAPSSAW